MATFISKSPEETRQLGERWGREAKAGWVVGLSGDLGAGKTQLVKGIASGLGVTGCVRSPTFALINEYSDGRLRLAHIDLYRLDTREQMVGAGLEEYFSRPTGIAVIEWAEKWFDRGSTFEGRASRVRRVNIEALGETERRITYEDFGP